jgi:hypothetical protein
MSVFNFEPSGANDVAYSCISTQIAAKPKQQMNWSAEEFTSAF